MIVLDTDIVSHLYYRHAAVTERRAAVPPGEPVLITVVSFAEMLRGRFDQLTKAATAEGLLTAQLRLDQAEEFLRGFPTPVRVNAASASLFAQFLALAKLRRTGHGDMMIAAITITLGATLVTRNVRDYRHVPNLDFTTW